MGVVAYNMHDKGSQSAERVVWYETGNLRTNDPEKAAKIMAWTSLHADDLKRASGGSLAGRKTETGDVYHYSLSWAKDEAPSEQHQRETARDSLAHLGLSAHEHAFFGHDDTEHLNVHGVVNLTHPETGKRAVLGLDKKALQAWALDYEREHGMYCYLREERAQQREQGVIGNYRQQKQDYSQQVTQAYYAADTGHAFIQALDEEGLTLAAARRGNGFIVVDGKGDIQKLARQLDMPEKGKAKTAVINAKLSDIDRAALPDADGLATTIKEILPAEKNQTQENEPPQADNLPSEPAHTLPVSLPEEYPVIQPNQQTEGQHFMQWVHEQTGYIMDWMKDKASMLYERELQRNAVQEEQDREQDRDKECVR